MTDPRLNQRDFGATGATTDTGVGHGGGAGQETWPGDGMPVHPSNGRFNRRRAAAPLGSRIVSDQERSAMIAAPAAVPDQAALATTAHVAPARVPSGPSPEGTSRSDAPLLSDEDSFRARWSSVQVGFVDDPRRAVEEAEQLVADVIADLEEGFRAQRRRLDVDGDAPTDDMRLAFHRYRDFFDRLLHL